MGQPATVAGVYAEALLQLADERGKLAEVIEGCRAVRAELTAERISALDDPRLGKTVQKRALAAALAEVPAELRDMLLLIIDRNRLPDVPAILAEALRRGDERRGFVRVLVRSPAPLPEAAVQRLREHGRAQVGANAIYDFQTEPALVGGLTVRVGDLLVDASVRRRLAEAKHLMLAAPISDDLWDGVGQGVSA